MGAPAGSSSRKPGNSGEVRQRRGACLTSSPMNRTEKTRRRLRAADAARRVQREHVKTHRVAGLQFPTENRKAVARAPRYWASRPASLRETTCAWASMKERGISHGPQVRAGDEFQGGFAAHRIHRNPEADVLPALDIVVGLILVPRRRLRGCPVPWSACDRGRAGRCVLCISRPAASGNAEFEDEAPVVRHCPANCRNPRRNRPGSSGAARDLGARAQMSQICRRCRRAAVAISSGRNNWRRIHRAVALKASPRLQRHRSWRQCTREFLQAAPAPR